MGVQARQRGGVFLDAYMVLFQPLIQSATMFGMASKEMSVLYTRPCPLHRCGLTAYASMRRHAGYCDA